MWWRASLAVQGRVSASIGARVILAARGTLGIDQAGQALCAAGPAAVYTKEFDADDLAAHERLLQEITTDHGLIGAAVLAFGVSGNQAQAEVDAAHAVAVVHTDCVAQIHLLTLSAHQMRVASHGRIVVFSLIAGIRVRRANYVYGSAKAGLDGFANRLADALHGSGVRLPIVRSGFVTGRMTTGMTPTILSSTPAHLVQHTGASGRRRRTRSRPQSPHRLGTVRHEGTRKWPHDQFRSSFGAGCRARALAIRDWN